MAVGPPVGPILGANGLARDPPDVGYDARMDEQPSRGTFEGRSRPPGTDSGRLATVVFGLIVIAVGLWFFADRTLGLDLPRINWGSLWPIVVIGLGIWILLGAANRRT